MLKSRVLGENVEGVLLDAKRPGATRTHRPCGRRQARSTYRGASTLELVDFQMQ